MSLDTASPRSRRALLTAALGAGAATIASALGRPLPARAADGNPVVVGGEYTAGSVTSFDTGATGVTALLGKSGSWIGVSGTSASSVGVYGASTSNIGVYGTSSSGTGIYGNSSSGLGVYGYSYAAAAPAILGASYGANTGVQGYSGASGTQPAARVKTGVYGYAAQDTSARGVYGETTVGQGVRGVATSGDGVRGVVSSGIGASGYATTGTAVLATSANPKVGTALQTIGKVKFDKSVGIATIAAGTSSVTVTPGIDLTTTSAVVATLQGSAGGALVERVSVNATTDQFTIYLSKNSTVAVKVAWHVFG